MTIATIDVLGTTYEIISERITEPGIDGQCDSTTHTIKIDPYAGITFGDTMEYQKQLVRHEIVHAFFSESGIDGDENTVEWIAAQFPKLLEVFKKVDCI